MARPRKVFDASDVDVETMDRARAAAKAKKARLMAEQELGIGDEGVGVVRGPAPIKDEEMVSMHLDMYPGALEIRIDDKVYRNGQNVTVTKREANSIAEMIARGWRHQEEIDGKAHNFYKPRMSVISGRNA